jgi:hypothetical protein
MRHLHMRCMPRETPAPEIHAREIHAHEMHAREMHAYEMHAHETPAHEIHTYDMHAHEVHVYETHTYQMHDRLTVTNRPRFGCDSQARTPNHKPGLRLINTWSLGQNPYFDSLGIGGGEADGTAVMEGGQATVVCPI